jgi:hypothetical protein
MTTLIADFDIRDEGSVWLFEPKTPEAEDWWAENVEEGMTYCGANVVEWRPARDIVDGIIAEGFQVTLN